MEQIVEQDNIVTTQIFDSSMPSSIDFDNPNDGTSQKPNIQSEKKIPEMGKVLVIGDQMVSFSVKGKLIKQLQPKYLPGVPITVSLNTLPVKMQDQQASSLMKLWSSLVGHSRRQVLIEQGYMYILQKQKQGLYVRATFNLSSLFKLFVDPQEQRVRLVIRQQQNVITRDLYPDNFIVMTERIQHELVQIGLSLVQ